LSELLSGLVPRLKALDKGGYSREYGRRGSPSGARTLVSDILDSLSIPYKTDVKVPGTRLRADFEVNGTLLFVDRSLTGATRRSLEGTRRKCVLIEREAIRSDRFDHGIRVLGLEEEGEQQTIFLDDPTFSFDYAHILPKTAKCSVMHGHTSSVLVEVIGRPIDGMVVDFGLAKQLVRDATRSLDHKLFINKKYVTGESKDRITLDFETVHGNFSITAPKPTTVLLHGEATVENLAKEVLSRVSPRMPSNVTAVGVYVYEGLNKGSHVLARVHQIEVEQGRKRP
jgi:6-pyruvoyltetrahydropterin/6-carboxytetrahydropterin synthase